MLITKFGNSRHLLPVHAEWAYREAHICLFAASIVIKVLPILHHPLILCVQPYRLVVLLFNGVDADNKMHIQVFYQVFHPFVKYGGISSDMQPHAWVQLAYTLPYGVVNIYQKRLSTQKTCIS